MGTILAFAWQHSIPCRLGGGGICIDVRELSAPCKIADICTLCEHRTSLLYTGALGWGPCSRGKQAVAAWGPMRTNADAEAVKNITVFIL